MNTSVNVNSMDKDVILSHVSWGSVIAGALIATSTFFMLILLSSALGMSIMDFEDGVSLAATTWINGIWLLLSSLISVACGAYVAGRLSENVSSYAGMISGILVWALLSIVSITLIAKRITYTLSASVDAVVQLVPDQFPDLGNISVDLNLDEILMKDIERKIEEIKAPELKMAIKQEYGQLKNTAKQVGESMLYNPSNLERGINRLETQVKSSAKRMDRLLTDEKIKEIVAANNSELSEAEVKNIANNWKAKIDKISQSLDQKLPQLKERLKEFKAEAVEKADEIKNGIALSLGVLFLMMIIGLITSIFAGKAGVRASKITVL